MSVLPSERVYTGFWIDHSKQSVLGATITIKSDTAYIIVAVLSIIIAFAGSFIWDIVAFCSFALYAAKQPRDGLHHQRQILLRNIPRPAAVVYRMTKMYWPWHGRVPRLLSRLVHLSLIALVCSVGFLVAGVFASRVVTSSELQVLAHSDSCGFQDRNVSISSKAAVALTGSYFLKVLSDSQQYARNCYNGSKADPSCQVFTTREIPFHSAYSSCPFDDELCLLRDNQALTLDSGLLYSDDIFGMNVKSKDSMAMRDLVMCSPLDASRFSEVNTLDSSDAQTVLQRQPLPGEQVVGWNLGQRVGQPYNATWLRSTYVSNSTQAFSSFGADAISNPELDPTNFDVSANNYFMPIPQLSRANGDLALVGIGLNARRYRSPVDDPVFAAHRAVNMDYDALLPNSTRSNGSTLYFSDQSAGWIGCQQQYQFCLRTGECTSVAGVLAALTEAQNLTLSPLQNATLYSFANILANFGNSMSNVLYMPNPFLASGAEDNFGLPSNQWEEEVKSWYSIKLAFAQSLMADFAAGSGRSGEQFDALPKVSPGPYEHILCHSQKMMAPDGFTNLHVFGLAFTVACCGSIALVSLVLPRVLRMLSRRRSMPWIFMEQWDQHEILQFQRTAFESNGIGTWTGGLAQVPVTVDNERFLTLADATSSTAREPFLSTTRFSNSIGTTTATISPNDLKSEEWSPTPPQAKQMQWSSEIF